MMIMQRAGTLELRTFTDGYPLRVELTDLGQAPNTVVLSVDDLHDLRYAIDRLLAKVAEHEQGRR